MKTGTPMPGTPMSQSPMPASASLRAGVAGSDPLARCVGCGYDLRGYADEGRCPECGGNVGASRRERLRRERVYGPSMRRRVEPWLLRAGIGFVLFVIGTLMWVAVTGHGARDRSGAFVPIVLGLLLVTDLVLWLGAWLITMRPQVERRHARWLRRSFRAIATVWLAAHGAFLVEQIVHPSRAFGMEYLLGAWRWAAAIGTVIGFAYLANISARLDFFSVRRSCIALSAAATMLLYAAAEKHWTEGMPTIAGIGLPVPMHPMLGSIDVHLDLSRLVLRPEFWPLMWRQSLVGVAWLVGSLSTLTWFALATLLHAFKQPEGDA